MFLEQIAIIWFITFLSKCVDDKRAQSSDNTLGDPVSKESVPTLQLNIHYPWGPTSEKPGLFSKGQELHGLLSTSMLRVLLL